MQIDREHLAILNDTRIQVCWSAPTVTFQHALTSIPNGTACPPSEHPQGCHAYWEALDVHVQVHEGHGPDLFIACRMVIMRSGSRSMWQASLRQRWTDETSTL